MTKKTEAETSIDERTDDEITAEAEKLGFGDFVFAILIAVGVFLLQVFWAYPGVHPSCWNDVAVAAGVRPAANVVPGYWHTITGFLFPPLGMDGAVAVLKVAGHVSLAIIAMFVYCFLREVLTFVMRARPQQSPRRKLVMRIAASIGAISFAGTDYIWCTGQFFSETTLLLALTVAAIEFFFAFLRKGTLKYSYVCAILLGFLTAETPIGMILILSFIFLNFLVIKVFPNLESPFFKPAQIEVGKWHMTFFLLAAFIAGIAFNCYGYISHEGLVVTGDTAGSIPLKYLQGYVARMTSAASLAGWILLLGFAFGPFIVSIVRFTAAADEENFLSYTTGIVFLFCGALAFSQCASLPALWFWTYVDVNSSYLLSLCALMCVITVACAITILGVDSLCRDHRRLARRFYGAEDEEVDDSEERVMSVGLTENLRKLGIVIVPLLLIAAVLPGRIKESTRAMLTLVDDVVKATVDEAGDAKYIFTDGNLDSAIEIESRSRGGDLKCISLMGGSSIAVYLRTRDMTDPEDLFSFKFDGAMGLRGWIRDKHDRLAESAVQIGFDLWKRDGKSIPPIGGLLSRPLSDDAEARAKAEERAMGFAKRAMEIYDAGTSDCTEKAVKKAFYDVEWRIARMCLYRAEAYDLAGNAKSAIENMDLYKQLNDRNDTFKQLVKDTEKRNEQMMRRLTPREGLQLALVRADFQLGKVYAESILGADLENPDANFAMGMYYLQERQLSRAEEYLKRCLIRKPDEAAVYNNLAMIQLELGKLDAAEINVKRALELVPESAVVIDTQKAIEKARKGKAEGAVDEQKK